MCILASEANLKKSETKKCLTMNKCVNIERYKKLISCNSENE